MLNTAELVIWCRCGSRAPGCAPRAVGVPAGGDGVTYGTASLGGQARGVAGDEPVLLVQPARAVQDTARTKAESGQGHRVRQGTETARAERGAPLEIIHTIPFSVPSTAGTSPQTFLQAAFSPGFTDSSWDNRKIIWFRPRFVLFLRHLCTNPVGYSRSTGASRRMGEESFVWECRMVQARMISMEKSGGDPAGLGRTLCHSTTWV